MTYLEKLQQLCPAADISDVHVSYCPDMLIGDIPGFRCPIPHREYDSDNCRSCWDSEIPGTEEGGV